MGHIAAFALWTLGLASSHLSAQSQAPARTQAPAPAPEPAQLGVLAPANLAKSRPKAPFDLTGTWLHNTPGGTERFDPPQGFKLTPEAQVHYDAGQKATAAGKVYRSDISLCWPAGMPIMMTRVWPVSMIQLPTSIFMISELMNSMRIIYMDGRSHTDPDIAVPSFNGESIGHWDGDTLVIVTKGFNGYTRLDTNGHPHSHEMVMTNTFLRTDSNTMQHTVTVHDPKTYTQDWMNVRTWRIKPYPDVIMEYSCEENNLQNLFDGAIKVWHAPDDDDR
jgi:hypothetical protein